MAAVAQRLSAAGRASSLATNRRWLQRALLPTLAVAAVTLLATRRPDLFTQPHFYAEDGSVFYADSHNMQPLAALAHPVAGYLLVFQRLVAVACAPLGLAAAAVLYAVVALVMQALPAVFFASERMRMVVPSRSARIGVAALYIAISNAELTGSLTNTQWHLALLALLVVLAAPPVSRAGRVFDIVVLAVAAVTGPYVVFLLPLAALRLRREERARRWSILAPLAVSGAVQVAVMAINLHSAGRSTAPLGANPVELVFIVTNQMLGRLMSGYTPLAHVEVAVGIFLATAALLSVALVHGPHVLRYVTAFALAVAGAGLALPYGAVPHGTSWETMSYGVWGMRYFFLLPFCAVCGALLATRESRLRLRGVHVWHALIVVAVVAAAATHWTYEPAPQQHLDAYQRVLDAARPGTQVVVPIAPSGWTMTLSVR